MTGREQERAGLSGSDAEGVAVDVTDGWNELIEPGVCGLLLV
jgi:hypothetical protein